MLQVSDAYKELVKSNIRPKCEPIIKISGIDNEGKDIELIWQAKNIKDLKYKRAIDPVGRELPYMELTWTEIYTGKLNAENYPEKYNNIIKYMKVEFFVVQDLDFRNYWKTIFDGELKWSDLFLNTWKGVKNEISQETIKLATLFLNAKPTIKGKTITWVAKDLLSFLTDDVLASIGEYSFVSYLEEVSDMLRTISKNHINELGIYESILKSRDNILNGPYFNDESIQPSEIIVDSSFKDFLLNYIKVKNYFIVFLQDGSFDIRHFRDLNSFSGHIFDFKTMFSEPNLKNGLDISVYSFNQYNVYLDTKSNYEVSEYWQREEAPDVYFFDFRGVGVALSKLNPDREIYSYGTYAVSYSNEPIVVTPKAVSFTKGQFIIDNEGEIFTEDNKLNPLGVRDGITINRKNILAEYFKSKYYDLDFKCLPAFHIELGDIVSCETNLYNDTDNKKHIKGCVVSQEIDYSGTFKQKNVLHEYRIEEINEVMSNDKK